ncbi:putative fucosyltransferase WbgN domain protein [Escherichia coli DEC5A]|nr:putative fucosyltransferase WbgN domain protein [Escherichia coli DEC5A]
MCTERYYIDSIRYLKERFNNLVFLYLVMISNGVRNIKMKYFQGVMM